MHLCPITDATARGYAGCVLLPLSQAKNRCGWANHHVVILQWRARNLRSVGGVSDRSVRDNWGFITAKLCFLPVMTPSYNNWCHWCHWRPIFQYGFFFPCWIVIYRFLLVFILNWIGMKSILNLVVWSRIQVQVQITAHHMTLSVVVGTFVFACF